MLNFSDYLEEKAKKTAVIINPTKEEIKEAFDFEELDSLSDEELEIVMGELIEEIMVDDGLSLDEALDFFGSDDMLMEATEGRWERVKSAAKKAGRAIMKGVGYAGGVAKRAVKASGEEIKKGYERGSRSSSSSSTSSSSSSNAAPAAPEKDRSAAKSRLNRMRMAKVKRGIKKVAGKTARLAQKGASVVSKGADKVAKKLGEENIQRIGGDLENGGLEVVTYTQEEVESIDEAMSSYDRNRKRAAQRAADRNAARAAGKTGAVPGVGYVTPRKEKETYTDEKGTVRHKSGAKNEEVEVEEYVDFLITEGYDCSDLTWDDMYEEYQSLDEGLRSAVKRLLGKKKEEPAKPMSRGDQLRKKYNVGPEKSDTSAKAQILKRTRAKAERDQKEFGGSRYSKGVADKSKAAHERQLKGGYSKYGADDARGKGNKARKRAAALTKEGYAPGDVDQKIGAVSSIPKTVQDDAKARILAKAAAKRKARLAKEETVHERADMWHPDPEKDKKLGGPGANARAREDGASSKPKPKADSKKLRPGESYMDYSKRQKASKPKSGTAVSRLNAMGANIKKKEGLRDKIKRKLGLRKEELELDERTRYAKETGKDPQTGKPSEKGGTIKPGSAMSKVRKSLAGQGLMSTRKKAIQPQGKKKEKGAKVYQGVTPVDKIKGNLARKRAPKPNPYKARPGESD